MAGKEKGKYYSPIYVPKQSPAKIRRMKLIRRSVLGVLSLAIFAVILIAWQSGRTGESVMEVAAARQPLLNVTTYPRIVDQSDPLPRSYEPENLVSLNTVPNGESVYLRADAAEGFLNMLDAMTAGGMAVLPIRGYVSYDEQSAICDSAVDKYIAEGCSSYEAEEKVWDELPGPGESEAQLGTLIEVSTDPDSVEKFGFTEQYQWICLNAYKYGFVVRQSEKPWQLRYVGPETAEMMQTTGLDLNEYVWAVQEENPSATQEAY